MLEGIFALLGVMVVGGLIGYAIARLTVAVLKKIKTKIRSKLLAIRMRNVVRELARDPSVPTYKLDELSDDEAVLIEYDPYSDKILQANPCETVDDVINVHMMRGNGVAIYD